MIAPQEIRLRYSDGYEAFARLWLPSNPRGAVLYLHGIQSHGGWFENSAQRVAEAGFAVLLPDRRGSGRNDQDRGHAPSPQRLLDDVTACCDELQARTGLNDVQLLAVSWGGKLALACCDRAPERISRITLVAPGLFPKVDLPTAQKVRVGLAALVKGRTLFDIPLQEPSLFTENPARQAFIANDPLALRQVTAGFLIASRRLDGMALHVRRRTSGPPLCLFLAGQDRIIDNDATREFVRQLEWPGRRIIEYEHAHHTLEFEPQPESFFSDLVGWLGSAP